MLVTEIKLKTILIRVHLVQVQVQMEGNLSRNHVHANTVLLNCTIQCYIVVLYGRMYSVNF